MRAATAALPADRLRVEPVRRAGQRDPARLVRLAGSGMGLASAGAAVIHAAVIPEHFAESRLAGAFFIAVSVLQAVSAILLLRSPSKELRLATGLMNAAVIAVWAMSRTTGLPIGPSPGVAEAVGRMDLTATGYEGVVVLLWLLAGRAAEGDRRTAARRSSIVAGAWMLPAAAALAAPRSHAAAHGPDAAHLLQGLGHHGLHVLLIGGAAVVFFGYAARLLLDDRWPAFTWRLDPTSTNSRRGAF